MPPRAGASCQSPEPHLEFSGLCDELEQFSRIAKDYLSPGGLAAIAALVKKIKAAQSTKMAGKYRLDVVQQLPITTIVSEGRYRRDGKFGDPVHGRVTFVWDARHCVASQKKGAPAAFELVDKSSVTTELVRGTPEAPGGVLAHWNTDIADSKSPGCFFHVQVKGSPNCAPTCPYWPKDLDIPRLPGLFTLPTDCIEFLLGELFQVEWPAAIPAQNPTVAYWRGFPRDRLRSVLRWYLDTAESATGGAWTTIKLAKPHADLLIG
jgi:hypothetical protein